VIARCIGSVRRECLDHVIILTAAGLPRLLTRDVEYYEHSRTALSQPRRTCSSDFVC
jgi:hypothetical protein